MLTFQKEITFLNPAFFDTELNDHIEKEVTKTATFKELSRTDRDQHELHFMIMAAFEETKGKKVRYDSSQVLNMTDSFIESCMIIKDEANPGVEIGSADKTQFLNDSIAKLNFGLWLLNEKFSPFFAQLAKK